MLVNFAVFVIPLCNEGGMGVRVLAFVVIDYQGGNNILAKAAQDDQRRSDHAAMLG